VYFTFNNKAVTPWKQCHVATATKSNINLNIDSVLLASLSLTPYVARVMLTLKTGLQTDQS